jgi:hypothetical protein
MHKNMKKLIYRSLDDDLSKKEKLKLDKALERSEELRRVLSDAQKLRAEAKSSSVSFAPMFAERVVRTIRQKNAQIHEDFFSALNYMFRRVALVGAIAVVVMFSIVVLTKNQTSTVAEYAMTQMTLDDLVDPTLTTSLEDIL